MAGSHKAGPRGPGRRTGHNGRRKRGRGKVAGAIALSLVVLAAAGAGWIYLRLNQNIDTFGSDGVSGHRPRASAGGQNVLVIGSDTRSGSNSRLGGGGDAVGRSDTAFLLHVYSDGRHAVAVSFPRDALVDLPACKLPRGGWTSPQPGAMFNSAFSVGQAVKGNPACTLNTVEKLTGLRVDHTVVVDFEGFARMTSAIGGVPVCVPNNVYAGDLDPNLGTRGKLVFAKGRQTVSGQRALDYVRLRHGIGDGSDIGRIQRQQAFVSSLIKKIKSQGFSPTTLLPLANAATKSLTVDEGLGTAQKMVSFAMSMKKVDLSNTKFITLPWRYQGARVAVQHPQADALFADLRADRTLDGKATKGSPKKHKDPSSSATPVSGRGIQVTVYNGTTVTGLAAQAAAKLRSDHFTVAGTATAGSQTQPTTQITYGPGEEQQAATVATVFPGSRLVSGGAPGVTVTLGQDFARSGGDSGHAAGSAPGSAPSGKVGEKARSASDDSCSNLTYG
jgi:LCP family protein required for cell wall assembly